MRCSASCLIISLKICSLYAYSIKICRKEADNCSDNLCINFLDLLKRFVQIELITINPIDSNSKKNSLSNDFPKNESLTFH